MSPSSLPKWRAVLKASWKEGATTFVKLNCGTPTVHMCGKEWAKVALIGLAFAVTFATLLAKNGIASFENEDQIWHQAFVDYDVDWHTPIFSFAGNVLNNFGIQPPLNTQLLPVLGLSQLFAHHQHILAALIMFSISMALLFWAIGATWGIPPVSRSVFAGLVTSITTIPFPYGPDLISWPLPPNFFTAQFLYGLWWQEAHILFLVTVIFFHWIGQGKSVATNILYGVGFGLPATPLTAGSSTQSGALPVLPVCQVGGIPASLAFAGLAAPGLYQLNLTVPAGAADGDNAIRCTYNSSATPAGDLITVQR